jgi:hypothetical protein
MSNELDKLPGLIERAISRLESATSAAEVLDAKDQAKFAYDAAKISARLEQARKAHSTVLAACHRMQADALMIESRAQCRIADEYDAAQQRGEVHTQGIGKSNLPHGKVSSTVADIGLTYKQVHEARAIRDAEKERPGMIKKVLDERLQAGEEPTRADVKRAVRGKTTKPANTKPKRSVAPTLKKARAIVRPIIASGDPVHVTDLEAKHGISNNVLSNAASMERQLFEERKAEEVDFAAALTGTQKQKYETAIRQMRKKMEAELAQYKYQANTDAANHMDQWLEETLLPKLRQEQAEAKDIIESRKGIMDKATFNRIRRCLHIDSRLSVTDKVLNEAFTSFTTLEKRLLKQADSPTEFAPIPKNRKEWEALRRKKRPRKTNERGEVIQFPGKAS